MQAAVWLRIEGTTSPFSRSRAYLGGALPIAAMVKGFDVEDVTLIIDFYKAQIKKEKVKVDLSREFTAADLDEIKPDVAVVAVGGNRYTRMCRHPTAERDEERGPVRDPEVLPQDLRPKKLRTLTKMWMPVGKDVSSSAVPSRLPAR